MKIKSVKSVYLGVSPMGSPPQYDSSGAIVAFGVGFTPHDAAINAKQRIIEDPRFNALSNRQEAIKAVQEEIGNPSQQTPKPISDYWDERDKGIVQDKEIPLCFVAIDIETE